MATGPLICDTIDFEGSVFQRDTLQIIQGTTVLRSVFLGDTDITLNDYASFNGCVYPASSLLLNADGMGELSFIMIKATFPTTLPVASRFINIIYKGKYLPMGGLTILTGNPETGSPAILGRGWDLDPNGSELTSPYYSEGGMLLYNPHSVRVSIEVILASGIS